MASYCWIIVLRYWLGTREPLSWTVSVFNFVMRLLIDVRSLLTTFCRDYYSTNYRAIFLFASGTKPVITGWWPAYIVGAFLAQWTKKLYPANGRVNVA